MRSVKTVPAYAGLPAIASFRCSDCGQVMLKELDEPKPREDKPPASKGRRPPDRRKGKPVKTESLRHEGDGWGFGWPRLFA